MCEYFLKFDSIFDDWSGNIRQNYWKSITNKVFDSKVSVICQNFYLHCIKDM